MGALQKGEGGVRSPSQRAGTGWEALEDGLEGSGGPFGEPGGVLREERGRESLLEGWEGLVDPSGVPGRVGRARRGWDSHLEGREGLGGTLRGPGVVRRASRRAAGVRRSPAGMGGDRRSPRGPRGVESSSQNAWMGRETLSQGRAVLGGPPKGLLGVGRPIQMAGAF